ncbi:MAG: enoyl-CoA hydratase/isomerase family protein [Pseudomonadota bacterium]
MDLIVKRTGRTGHITLNRPQALNALTWEMCLEIEKTLDLWASYDAVTNVIFDAAGDKAFCAGGDIVEMYETGLRKDYAYGRRFWRDEYRLNAKIFEYPKPVISFLQGFTMGGGVGIGCHGTHRIVGETSQIAMPEVSIGLIPDVGGSLMLALAPGRLGEYLGTTAHRMSGPDAIYAGFADHFMPEAEWDDVKTALNDGTDPDELFGPYAPPNTPSDLEAMQADIDRHFGGETLSDILRSLNAEPSDFTQEAIKRLSRNAPLSMACAVELIHRLRPPKSIRQALELEYRFTHRAMEDGDFLEGIRAAVIDKDRAPKWKHSMEAVPFPAVSKMLQPLGAEALLFEEAPS